MHSNNDEMNMNKEAASMKFLASSQRLRDDVATLTAANIAKIDISTTEC